MTFISIRKYLKIFNFLLAFGFMTNLAIAQEENVEAEDNNSAINEAFPIAVVDMQKIVGQSLAAVKVREFIENKKQEFTSELKNGKEKGLALTLDTSSVVIAANSINISNSVIELLNINLPEVDMNAILNKE